MTAAMLKHLVNPEKNHSPDLSQGASEYLDLVYNVIERDSAHLDNQKGIGKGRAGKYLYLNYYLLGNDFHTDLRDPG